MGLRTAHSALVLLTVLVLSSPGASASPEVAVASPVDGSVLLTSSVVVAGTASGSHAEWTHGGAADFGAGILDRVEVSDDVLRLAPRFRDDFDDNTFNTTAWERFDIGGVATKEENGGLHQVGTNTVSSYWGGVTYVFSKDPVGNSIQAQLLACVGSGSGYWTMLVLYQDDSNQAGIGVIVDRGRGWTDYMVYWGCINQGVQTNGVIQRGREHVYKVAYTGGNVDLLVDGAVVKSISMTLASPKAKIFTTARANGDTVESIWDDFVTSPASMGTYVSGVHDTRAVDPVLTRADWNASLPSGTSVGIEVRSSDTADMGNSTAWAKVTMGQSSGLPAARRYLQYRATLESPGMATPSLRDVTLSYMKPVKWVDVSLDQANWTRASGREAWSAVISAPDGPATVWVRATDVAGDTRTTSVMFDVDTTPPAGSVLINGGDGMTATRTVALTLAASDRYGVADMMVGETPALVGAEWVPFGPTTDLTLSPGDGTRAVYARFRDRNGWTSATVNDTIILDTTPPWGSVLIDGDADLTNTTAVVLSLDAGDLSGVVEMRVGDAPDLSSQPWRPFSRELAWVLPSGDGVKAVHAAFRDPLGHESAVVSDSIVLDTTAPVAHVSINDGAAYTSSTDVTLTVTFDDPAGAAAILVGEDPSLAGASWEAPSASRRFALSPGDGARTVHVRARDAAGNVGAVASATIVLDTTAPVATVGPLPAKTGDTSFKVMWSATDAISGVVSCDVQRRDGEGPWVDWLNATDATNATFEGADGHTYTFRARARDLAGNLGSYSGSTPVRVLVPIVSVTVDGPLALANVSGRTTFRGTASHTDPEMAVVRVEVSLDGGAWQPATGTTAWSLEMDLGDVPDGVHTLRARATDGTRWSGESSVTFIVDNPSPKASINGWLLAILIMAIVAAAIAAYVWRRSRALQGG